MEGKKKSQSKKKASTLKMRRNLFSDLTEKKMTVKEVAKKYGLSTQTVYNALDDVASKHGVTRESLLTNPAEGRGNHSHNSGRKKTSGRKAVADTISDAIKAAEEVTRAMSAEIEARS